jgi:lipopolysaccharide/colanic/teichoic acid biosynthesis glycosyltransferase
MQISTPLRALSPNLSTPRIEDDFMVDSPSARLFHASAPDVQERARRVLDLVVAGLAMVVLSPIMLLIALAICLESGAPVLFRQVRLGQHGRRFYIYKFRKFHRDCGTDGSPLTFDGDARMTSVGLFLRATKLDELPQFWNVIRGDMSIIGPRPESLAFADCFTGTYERVLGYRPGILGPSQVTFRNESSLYAGDVDPDKLYRTMIFPTKARIDLDYYDHRTLLSDILWIVRGVLAIMGLQSSGASRPPAGGSDERLPGIGRGLTMKTAHNPVSTRGK